MELQQQRHTNVNSFSKKLAGMEKKSSNNKREDGDESDISQEKIYKFPGDNTQTTLTAFDDLDSKSMGGNLF